MKKFGLDFFKISFTTERQTSQCFNSIKDQNWMELDIIGLNTISRKAEKKLDL